MNSEILEFILKNPRVIIHKLIMENVIEDSHLHKIKLWRNNWRHSQSKWHDTDCQGNFNKLKNISTPINYASLYIKSQPDKSNLILKLISQFNDVISKGSESIRSEVGSRKNTYQIFTATRYLFPIDKFEEFMELCNLSDVTVFVDEICVDMNLNDNYNLLKKYKHSISWYKMQLNPNLIWNNDFIHEIVDYLNWEWMPISINWNKNTIKKFKDLLPFSTKDSIKSLNYTDYYFGKYRELYAIISFNPINTFWIGNKFVSFSQIKHVLWDKELISCIKEYLDWDEFSLNPSIKFDDKLISQFESFINFNNLSKNTGVKWSEKLIEKYENKLNWVLLSGNPSLPWSMEFIEKYQNRWQWKPEENFEYKGWTRYSWEKTWKADYNFEYLGWQSRKWEELSSISTNEAIEWNVSFIEKYLDKLDLFYISCYGKVNISILRKYSSVFDVKQIVAFKDHDFSDWHESEIIYSTCWENLSLNKNFTINKSNFDYLFDNEIELTKSVGNLSYNGYYETRKFTYLELVKNANCLDIVDLKNLVNCSNILYNEEFINDGLFNNLLKPHLSHDLIELFFKELLKKYGEFNKELYFT
jgi:hypothetical protein